MRYVRRKDNPLVILKSGSVGPGGLGAFDSDLFEEVEGDLPEGWQNYQPPAPLDERVAAAFAALPLALQVKFTPQITQFEMLFRRGNLPVILAMIDLMADALVLPDEQAVKDILDAAKAELAGS